MAYTRKMAGKVPVLKQDLIFDEIPTAGSENAVTSGGVAESVSQQSSNIAEAFSASSTYAIGEVVIGPDGKLYQCTTAVETAGEWDPEDWDETSLGDILFTSRGSSNIEVRKSHCKVGDAVYADGDGNVHFIAGKSVVAADIPADWEFTGVVALREVDKATILYKTENTSVKWASMWLFKVNGLKLDGTDTFVLQQGPTSGSTPVEIGTFTATAAATDLDTLVDELDDWLRENNTAEGALANYNWHAEKHAAADGVDACFIVVDNGNNQSRVSPIKSSTSGATATLYMWDWCGLTSDSTTIKRKDGVMTPSVVWNKERFNAYNTNINSPTDSLTTIGLFNEDGFNATTTVKGYYGTYDNYLDNMAPDKEATTGAYALFKGKGKEVAEAIADIVFPNLSGTDTAVFSAESWVASQKAHSTASVEGLNAGDFFAPSIDMAYEIFSAMKDDGSDAVNSALVKAGVSKFDTNKARWIPAMHSVSGAVSVWLMYSPGAYNNTTMVGSPACCAVAEIDL